MSFPLEQCESQSKQYSLFKGWIKMEQSLKCKTKKLLEGNQGRNHNTALSKNS